MQLVFSLGSRGQLIDLNNANAPFLIRRQSPCQSKFRKPIIEGICN